MTPSSYGALRSRPGGRGAFAKKWNVAHHLQIGVGLRDFRRYHEFEETACNRSDFFHWEGLGASDHGHLPPMQRSYLRVWDDGHATAYEGLQDYLDSKLSTANEILAEKEEMQAKLKMKDSVIDDLTRQMDAIINSRSWRITKPLRVFAALFLPLRRFFSKSRARQ